MKHFYLWMIFCILYSCHTQDDVLTEPAGTQHNAKTMTTYPENKANAFDLAGRLHNELCGAYETTPSPILTINDAVSVVDLLSVSNPTLTQLTPEGFTPLSDQRLEFIVADSLPASQVIEQSTLSLKAKISLANFVSVLELYKSQQKPYDQVYDFILSYENSVAQDPTLTSTDKQILFTTSSIARHAHHFASVNKKKPPRDKDWDIKTASILAGCDGSQQSTVAAVRMAAAASIYINRR